MDHDSPHVWDGETEANREEDPEDDRVVVVEGHAVQFNEYRY
ncbi:hypothetical protein GCM10027435_14990 [Haloparvum alkalitolerans]